MVAYDDRALYVFVRAFDPRPDSIVRLLSRRDTDGPPNDQVQLFIDSFYDRRSGYEYIVNAAGVKSDYLLFDDTGFDQSWDGVWDVGNARGLGGLDRRVRDPAPAASLLGSRRAAVRDHAVASGRRYGRARELAGVSSVAIGLHVPDRHAARNPRSRPPDGHRGRAVRACPSAEWARRRVGGRRTSRRT